MIGRKATKVQEGNNELKRFVLVVDSHQRDASYTSVLLQNLGYRSTIVRSGEEALEFTAVATPALVIAELVLPGMNGFDLCERMRHAPSTSAVPYIIQTRFISVESEDHCRQMGCAGCLNKPVPPLDLYRTVQQAIETTPRQNIRVEVSLPVTINDRTGGSELITSLSDAGLFVRTLAPLPGGSLHTISFVLGDHVIRVEARVLYENRFDRAPQREPGMAMTFTDLSAVDLDAIQNHIRAAVSPGFGPGEAKV